MTEENGKKESRKFGISFSIVLAVWGLFFLLRKKGGYVYFFTFSGLLLFFGLFLPAFLAPLRKFWMVLTKSINWLITRIVLITLFFLLITPLGLIMRLFKKDLLGIKIDKNAGTYWIPKPERKVDRSDYERQF